METTDYNLWQLFAGIGMFIYGMQLLEHAIHHLAGRSFKVFLRDQTKHPFKAVIAGLVVTALLQSSSIVNLLVLAFVGARILTMQNALAIFLGSNVGSTVYNWIVVFLGFKFDIQSFAFPMLALSAIGLIFFQEHKKIKHWTHLVIGMSLLFLGLANIKSGVESMVMATDFSMINKYGNYLFVIAGFLITALVQSSSTLVVIALSALNAGVISFEAAACLVIGSEPGTALKTILVSTGSDADKKRVAVGNLILNVVASGAAFILLKWLVLLIQDVFTVKDPLIGLVLFQTMINIICVLIFYPFLSPFARWLDSRFRDINTRVSLYLNNLLFNDSDEAVNAIIKESTRLIQNIIHLNIRALELENKVTTFEQKNVLIKEADEIGYSEYYEMVKQLNGEIIDFCLELKEKDPGPAINKRLDYIINTLRFTMNSAKSMKDIRHNVKEYRDSADDTLHEIYIQFRKREEPFYSELSEFVNHMPENSRETFSKMRSENTTRHESAMHEIYMLSSHNKIQHSELSTLFNVFESIRLSNESLLIAIGDLFMPQESNREFLVNKLV